MGIGGGASGGPPSGGRLADDGTFGREVSPNPLMAPKPRGCLAFVAGRAGVFGGAPFCSWAGGCGEGCDLAGREGSLGGRLGLFGSGADSI